VLVVAEALHASAREDVGRLAQALVADVAEVWSTRPASALLDASAPRFALP
jgi:hypothetical protein